uniref:Uncharacterized protein n=1 Tax=Ditylenchus dipsaci TaxID=166011 RepID=A0A915DJ20_9BILA
MVKFDLLFPVSRPIGLLKTAQIAGLMLTLSDLRYNYGWYFGNFLPAVTYSLLFASIFLYLCYWLSINQEKDENNKPYFPFAFIEFFAACLLRAPCFGRQHLRCISRLTNASICAATTFSFAYLLIWCTKGL